MTSLRILHLTDTHLFGDDSRHYDRVDTREHLTRALGHVGHLRFDLVVCSGDVSEDGTAESYRWLRETLGTWARERGARVVYAMGNHDRRETFREVLGGGQPDAREQVMAGTDEARPVASAATVDGWRTIVLDSSIPQRGYGSIEPEQLEFLRSQLAAPAPNGTVLVIHHPPIDAQTELLQALALDADDTHELLDVLRGSDVRVVLSGHYHLPLVETVAGVPVVVAPGVANIARSFDDPREESAIDGFGGAVVDIRGERVRVAPFVERMSDDTEVFRFPADIVARIIDAAGQPSTRADSVS
ncbi:metallophosphoesterase [Microbacterium esteraromaticum]|uniref:metallophosphoesterase family protein n=1 Tax=Microbacterium esteraromaticum TaxID=57043 RepID=UPI001A8D506D|nr:metallophosphoesterase [Microbacterium esteraromaticum]MBN8424274.1 metallophosphoesterase [Microbacterium esteraromaticum]